MRETRLSNFLASVECVSSGKSSYGKCGKKIVPNTAAPIKFAATAPGESNIISIKPSKLKILEVCMGCGKKCYDFVSKQRIEQFRTNLLSVWQPSIEQCRFEIIEKVEHRGNDWPVQ
jgi:hypothetical protein